MLKNLEQLIRGYEPWQVAIELLVIGLCVTIVVRFLKGTRGAGIIKGFAVLLVVGTLAVRVLGEATDAFARLNFIYDKFLTVVAILLIVVFQPELRQAMIRLGHAWSFRATRSQMHGVVDSISEAVVFLSKSQFGALIAVERSARLGGLIESGIRINADVSARLLESIFWPNSPLHDLGTIIRGDQILAASVQFPLAEDGVLGPEFGSRHRAAAGLSLEADCVVIIVSEETGAISIAEHGKLEHDIPREAFRAALARRLAASDGPSGGENTPEPADRDEKQPEDEMQAA
jgi:diadenylate cyclase